MKQRAWVGIVVTAAVAAGASFAWRTRDPFDPVQRWLVVPALLATVAALVGARRRTGADAIGWLAIAGSCAMTAASYSLGFVTGALDPRTLDGLSGILRAPDRTLLALGLIAFVSARSPVRERYLAIEATVVSLTAMLVMWVLLIEPAFGRTSMGETDRMLSLALPASDLVLVTLAARMTLGYRAKSRAFSLLLAGLVVRLLANAVDFWTSTGEPAPIGPAVHGLTALSLALFAAAALDRTADEAPQVAHNAVALDRLRLATIALCAIVPQAVLIGLLISDNADRTTLLFAGVVTATVTLLALARLWGLAVAVRDLTERRGRDRLASLVERSSDVVVLVDGDHLVSYSSGALSQVLGVDGESWVGRPLTELGISLSDVPWPVVAGRILAQPPESTTTVEVSAQHADGSPRLLEVTAVNLVRNVAVSGIVITMRDITATRRLQLQLSFRADHDELTGLANRAQFLSRLSNSLAEGRRPVVMFIDLDGFKVVNDSMGHEAGDVLLREIAQRLRHRIPASTGTVARLGGDEFAALLPSSTTRDAARIGAAVVSDLRDPIALTSFHTVTASCSIGIAQPDDGNSASDVLRNADFAMYRAKRRGKGAIEVFDAELESEVARTEEYRRDLVSALGRDQFSLVYQPIVRLRDGRLVGAEALIRWNHHVYGAVSPGEFIEIAEQTGSIIPIGWWSIRQACITAAGWEDPSLFVTVNLSASQLRGASMVQHVKAALAESGLEAQRLVLEITESMLIDDPDGAAAELVQLRALGVRVALDDFGTGYSSLAYVQRLPLDIIKIDREFVQGVGRDAALTRTIVTMAHHLGLQTIGEGVEEESQVQALADMGCDYTQGFLVSHPLDAASMAWMLQDLAAQARTAEQEASASETSYETEPVESAARVAGTARAVQVEPAPSVSPTADSPGVLGTPAADDVAGTPPRTATSPLPTVTTSPATTSPATTAPAASASTLPTAHPMTPPTGSPVARRALRSASTATTPPPAADRRHTGHDEEVARLLRPLNLATPPPADDLH